MKKIQGESDPKYTKIVQQYNEIKQAYNNKDKIIRQQVKELCSELDITYTQQVCKDTLLCRSDIQAQIGTLSRQRDKLRTQQSKDDVQISKEQQKHQGTWSKLHHKITVLEEQNPQVKKRWQRHRIKEIRQQEQEQINLEKQVRKIQHQHDKVLQQ